MVRCLESIRLSWEGRSDYEPSIVISEEEFRDKYNHIFKYGSQEYAIVYMKAYKYDEDLGYFNIFYTKDGHVFIDGKTETALAYWSEDEIGDRLARICINHEGYARKQVADYARRMKKNYRNVR